MNTKRNKSYIILLLLFITFAFIMPFVSSCGKGGAASSVGLNTQIEILDLSPDLGVSVNLYVNFLKQGTNSFYYPTPSGYFYLNSLDTPLQIRANSTTTVNFITLDNQLLSNHKYTLFMTGLYATDSLTTILTLDDTTAVPSVGFGKIRFVNASVQSPRLDVTANGTIAFSKVAYKQVTPYQSLPAGNYNFQINQTGSTAILPANLPVTTIQDGRLYTLYTYGIVGRTDTSAFGAAVLTNR